MLEMTSHTCSYYYIVLLGTDDISGPHLNGRCHKLASSLPTLTLARCPNWPKAGRFGSTSICLLEGW